MLTYLATGRMEYDVNNFLIKSKIVRNGESTVFKNWQKLAPSLTPDDFLRELEWVCADDFDSHGRLTREIGLTRNGIVKLFRHNIRFVTFRHKDGRLWKGDIFLVPCDDPDYADENGMCRTLLKLSLSARDKI